MSRETYDWLNNNVLIGHTDKRGKAWHYRASSQGTEPNHYVGAVPVEDVIRRLFFWEAKKVKTAFDISDLLYEADDESRPVDADGKPAPVWRTSDDFYRIIRSDNYAELGTFREGYRVHNYQEWLLGNVATLLDSGLSIGSAGLLRGGAQAWVSVEVAETIHMPKEGVEFRPNLLACTSHDGSIATTYKRAATNVICDNTLSAGLRESGQVFKVKHSRNSLDQLTDARDALNMIEVIAEDFEAEVKALCEIDVSDRAWNMFLDAHAPLPVKPGPARSNAQTKRQQLRNLWTEDERVAPWAGTAWGVLQAVNTHTHHMAKVVGMSRPERNMARAVDGGIDKLDSSTVRTLNRVLAEV